MSLTKYKRKRDFKQTSEPKGGAEKRKKETLSFVVQKHNASHLHYDFRLELDGVLKSWAIPKGPSLNPSDKRLAVQVEDHPVEYGKFEGRIPEGNYGAGTVEIWDAGTYELDPAYGNDGIRGLRKGIETGSLKFVLHGKKLKGSFALVRLKNGKGNQWLLIKHRDEFATSKSIDVKKKLTSNKAKEKDPGDDTIKADGHTVKITNRGKVYWPDEGYTKGQVIDYYNSVAPYILPYLKDRPQSLRRNPNGIADKGFFHKDAGDAAPAWVKHVSIYAESSNKDIEYILCNNKATLLYLNNLGCIEINPWNSRIKKPDNPDYLIIDLDPSSSNSFDEVIDVAHGVKEVLDKAEATCYCKTSGASGIHIYIPLHAVYTYEQVRPFAELIAVMASEKLPDISTVERSLSKRKGRIYIDYLQNSRGQTLSSVYSLRPVPGASVSTPLDWKELKHGLSPRDFNINTIAGRLSKKGDLFEGVLREKINLKRCLDKLGQ